MKKLFITAIVLVVIITIVGIGYWLKKNSNSISDQKQNIVLPTKIPAKRIIWDDQAGFTFEYNSLFSINKHDEDQENYAHIEMSLPNSDGKIIVWAKDTNALNLSSWVLAEKEYQGANIIDTTLGKQPAKKIIINQAQNKMVTGSMYDGLLFMVELIGTNDDLKAEYNMIIDTFVFKPLTDDDNTSATTANDSSADDLLDEEETIE